MFSSDSLSKTRISAHMLDAAPAEDDAVTVEGWLTYYDERRKSWQPMKAEVSVYLDGREIGKAEANEYGMFSYTFPAPSMGKHKLEVRFKGKIGFEPSNKILEFQVIRREQKLRLWRLARDVLLLLIAISFLMFLLVFALKLR